MEKNEQISEQELANKINALLEEKLALELKKGNGITLEKNQYNGERTREIEKELAQLKTPKKET